MADYKIGDILIIDNKRYKVCEPFSEENRCAGCMLEDSCDLAPVNSSSGFQCLDYNCNDVIFIEIGKEKAAKLQWLKEKLRVIEAEREKLCKEIEEQEKEINA